MATITLEYDARNSNVKKFLDVILATNFFKVKSGENYNKDFVKKIKDAEKGKKYVFSEEMEKKYFGNL
ncbi:MAG: hypothetical protein MJ198_05155 [Bacteroidales bacterium]|nr:hypothetical protein [Bacteroidales bacterium]